ncbi:MAG: hypothetical protein Q9217_005400 [Psora testacea]
MDIPKQPSVSYAYLPVDVTSRNPWRVSKFRRLPWLGFGALLGALLGVAAVIAILIESNGQPIAKWVLQPTVYLAIASAITNILMHFALSEGTNVAWWRRATQEDVKIADLHRHWNYGNSLWAAITSGRHLNMVAVACILVAIGPINGPLLQRASRVGFGTLRQTIDMEIKIAQRLPDGYTGYISGRGGMPALLTSEFNQIVNTANTQAAINVSTTGCTGECATSVRGAGFAINCSTSTMPFSLIPVDSPGVFDTSQEAVMNGTRSFGSYFLWGHMNPGALSMGVQFKNSPACSGHLQLRNCSLQAAVVEYPVIVNGNKSTIELVPGSTMFDDTVINMTTVALNTMTGPSTLGGLYKALSDTYGSTANLRFVGAYNYELVTTGATANRYAILDPNTSRPEANCSLSFSDPSNDLIQAVRDMMFRTAIAAANSSDSQPVTAQETATLTVYQSHFLYLSLAALCTGLGWLATIPIFLGWWHVGRTVSMSPIETAKAFGAPTLRNLDSNADADMLLKEVGDRPIRYGAVAASSSGLDRLEMNDPQFIRTPRPGQTLVG